MLEKLRPLFDRFEEITALLSSPEILTDSKRLQKLSKEQSKLSSIVDVYLELQRTNEDFEGNTAILADPDEDPEMKEMAKAELPDLKKALEDLSQKAQIMLLPTDPDDDKNVILEIRAGTGGDEAGLFVGDLLRMYMKFAESNKWQVEIMDSSESSSGGYKEVVCSIEGKNVYSRLKFESGVHRVQRVPATETQGRVHTSACTVAILPESENVEVELNMADVRIDTYRASGAGGQHINKTDSAIRLTHEPTGIVVQCQEERSQIKNKAKAMKYLNAKLYDVQMSETKSTEDAMRKGMVGTGDRSERIRTYNYPQGRFTDHRVNMTVYRLEEIMQSGELNDIINALAADQQTKLLEHESQF
ncbi:MAG: peptide chain release factor 1 [SAR324 cluster bacterium]|nr:peptide chain release factor 1 [SAR324 cluster bacterium]